MYYDDHNPPHIHAVYDNDTACFTFDGELNANWKLAQEGEPIFKIKPLK